MQNAILANVAVVQSHCLPLPLARCLCIPPPLAVPQFKCRLTHCDAIASFLPFCFLSQIVCALERAKVEHVSALPPSTCPHLATCHLPPATWRTISGASTLPSYDILFNGTKGRPCLWQRQRQRQRRSKNLGLICRFSFERKWGKSTQIVKNTRKAENRRIHFRVRNSLALRFVAPASVACNRCASAADCRAAGVT